MSDDSLLFGSNPTDRSSSSSFFYNHHGGPNDRNLICGFEPVNFDQGRPHFRFGQNEEKAKKRRDSAHEGRRTSTSNVLMEWAERRRASDFLSPKTVRRMLPKTPPEKRRHERTLSESGAVFDESEPFGQDVAISGDVDVRSFASPSRSRRNPAEATGPEDSRNNTLRSQSATRNSSGSFCPGLARFLANNLRFGKNAKSVTNSTLDSAENDLELLEDSPADLSSKLGTGMPNVLLNHPSSNVSVPSSPRQAQSFFRSSRFSNIPPTVRFCVPNERVEKPRRQVLKMLKWCHNSLVPKVVRKCLSNSHFQIVHEKLFWMGYWGRHLKTSSYRSILPYQKVNHFPGTFHLGRKDRLWNNIHRMGVRNGHDVFNLMPRTYVLPRDGKRLKAKMRETGCDQKFILKPPASARGAGIRIVHKWSQIPKKQAVIVQHYIEKPFLINGSKFDLRLYVYVSCFNPLRVYLYEDGLVRFASVKYSSALNSLSNRFMHLTNYSINKTATGDEENKSTTGAKWTVRHLWRYLNSKGHDVRKLMEEICDLILKSIISCEGSVNAFIHQNTPYPFISHELFGFDIILDEDLKPWLLEINISPSLHSGTELDIAVKTPLAADVLNLCGVQVPDKEQLHIVGTGLASNVKEAVKLEFLDFRTKTLDAFLSDAEKEEQSRFVFDHLHEYESEILSSLNPSDVRVLVETEDEFDRKGQFTRLFPSPFSSKYLKYFEKNRYYNLLLDAWTKRYFTDREEGCACLEALCKTKMHLVQHSPDTQ